MTRLDDDYFRQVYADGPDPWGFDTRWYEARKRSITLAVLPEPRYRAAFEPGCALGHLSSMLAERCDELISMDLNEAMVGRTRERLDHAPLSCRAMVRHGAIPEDWPVHRTFDLVVLSEVAYYLADEGFDAVERSLGATLAVGGDLVAVHWTGVTDYPSTAARTHERLGGIAGLDHLVGHQDPEFRLDVWRRA